MELTEQEREALKALWRLSQNGAEVRTGDLAEALSHSPATATGRAKRLAERGLVDHTPYQGVALTPAGRRLALGAIRRHRIVERFLADMLGYPWDQADRLAVSFEHHLPQEVEDRLFIALHLPVDCPHGLPIPSVDAQDLPALPTLASLQPGDEAEVAIPGDTHPDVVAFLDGLGIRPGVRVTVRDRHPFDGPFLVSVNGAERTLAGKLAGEIYARPTRSKETSA